jgi:tetratricopeptide (TPR) repeat protein
MPESTRKSLIIVTYVALILSTLLVYWQVRNFDFVNCDDSVYIYENPHMSSGLTWDNVIWAFTTGYASFWHPMTWLSLMLDRQLFGPDPGWFHLTSVFLHLANTLLLFAVLKKMTGSLWRSAFVAAAFALHPMHVESVAWIAERKDVLSTFFLLLTLAAYTDYTKRPTVVRYIGTLVLFTLGLMAKPMLITLPFVLLLLDYWPLDRFELSQSVKTSAMQSRKSTPSGSRYTPLHRIIMEKIPFLVLTIVFSVVTFLTQQKGGGLADITTIPLKDRFGNASLSYAAYIGRMFWPKDLAAHYPFSAHSIQSWQVLLCFLLMAGVSLLTLRFWRSRKYLLVGWLWFVGTLIPVIGLVRFTNSSYADRFTYIPYTGLFIMIAWGLPELLSKWPQRRIALGLSMAVVLTTLGICAHRQVSYWNDSITLFSHAIEVTRDNYVAHYSRGSAYVELGRWQEAIEDFNQAISISPGYAEAYNGRGNVYGRSGRYQEAIEDFNQAISISPGHAEAYNNLGIAYGGLGRWQEAVDAYKQGMRIKPDYADAYYNLGNVYGKLGRWQEAIDTYKQGMRIKPDYAEGLYNLGAAYGGLGRWQEAIEAYKQGIKVNPNFAEARYNLAKALAGQGRYDEAIDQYRAALKLKGDWHSLMNSLAWLVATNPDIKNRDTNEAIRLASGACKLTNYEDAAFLDTLAAAYASAGKFSEAVDTANKALGIADAANQPQLRNDIQYHLSFYTQGKPYIESASKPLPDPNEP